MGLAPGATFDLAEDEFGVTYDVLKAADRQRIRARVARDQPFLVVGSPPCTDWCWYNVSINHHRMPAQELRRRLVERQVTLRFAVEIYCLQLAAGRHFLHEHPLGATSWRERCVRALERQAGVGTVVADQCQYGLVTRGPDGSPLPAKKATRFMSSAPAILEALSRRCPGTHRHQVLEGSGRAAAAARYPAALCRAILRGAEEQRRREGRAPAGVRQLQAGGLGVFELRRTADATTRQILEIDADILEEEVGDEEEGKAAFGGGDPTDVRWSTLATARLPQSISSSPTLDEYTGDVLPPSLVAAAKEEEVAAMEGVWDVWGVVPVAEAWRATGHKPIGAVGLLQQRGPTGPGHPGQVVHQGGRHL